MKIVIMSKYYCKNCKNFAEEIDFDIGKMICDKCIQRQNKCSYCGEMFNGKKCPKCNLCFDCG